MTISIDQGFTLKYDNIFSFSFSIQYYNDPLTLYPLHTASYVKRWPMGVSFYTSFSLLIPELDKEVMLNPWCSVVCSK